MQTPRRLVGIVIIVFVVLAGAGPATSPSSPALFARFDLPEEWKTRFWAEPEVKALLALEPKKVADLVPVQAGVRYCRCPNCDSGEEENSLRWDISKPEVLTCRRCKVVVPNDKIPAKDEKEKKVPEETIEVLPQVVHHYPYHVVDSEKQRYPDERLYLSAKRDYEAREFLAKAALYAAVRAHERPPGVRDPALTRLACVLILRFAQVYPAYATHFDQPGQPKYFQPAHVPPPYRRGFKTGKWDWTASLDVPLNLVIAYALLRDDPAFAEAGKILNDPDPARTIERDLFRASAEFVREQPDDFSEMSLQAYRGLLAAGQVLNDPALLKEAQARLVAFAERGFYHDGFWRQGDPQAHRRVLGMIDGWINRLLLPAAADPESRGPNERRAPMLALARSAGAAVLSDSRTSEVQPASWPTPAFQAPPRHPTLLGGAGLARLALGQGPAAFDLELRGPDSFASPHFQRLALRLSIGGQAILGDLDDLPPSFSGWDRSTACHNTVVVDGLNQRESAIRAEEPAPGADVLFFAADPDFQVATMNDVHAYPRSTTRYRHTVVLAGGKQSRYAVSVFEVHGGVQHDQIYHAAPGLNGRWQLSMPTTPPPASLLPPSIVHVPTARAEDGRWFVQAYGELTLLGQAKTTRPIQASLAPSGGGNGVRLHLIGDVPLKLFTAVSSDPRAPKSSGSEPERAGLILRRRSTDGSGLKSTFVTVFEPQGGSAPPFRRVGRVQSPEGTVVVYLETADGPEHLFLNLSPGQSQTVQLADGRQVSTDGPAVRVLRDSLELAGGTFAEFAGKRVTHTLTSGQLTRAVRKASDTSRGWFETKTISADSARFAGRVLLIQHGDGTTHGWTIQKAESGPGGTRFHVIEEPGFLINETTHEAHYYQFPGTIAPGPHEFWVLKIAR